MLESRMYIDIEAFFSITRINGDQKYDIKTTFLYADSTHVYLQVWTSTNEGDYMEGYVVIYNKNKSKIC